MTYHYLMKAFEWDKHKQAAHLNKPGIDFMDATKIFDDRYRIEFNSIRQGKQHD